MTDDFDDDGRLDGRDRSIDHRAAPTRVGLIVPDLRSGASGHSIEMRKAEFEGLAKAIHLEIVFSEVVRVREVRPATFIGGGHVADLKKRVEDERIELLLVDAALAPIQQRNL